MCDIICYFYLFVLKIQKCEQSEKSSVVNKSLLLLRCKDESIKMGAFGLFGEYGETCVDLDLIFGEFSFKHSIVANIRF
jgi:hypothetical protein